MELTDIFEMIVNSPILSAFCVLVVVMAADGEELNGHLARMAKLLDDINERLSSVEKSQTRMETQIEVLIGRSGEDRSRIGVAESSIVELFRKQDTIEDRQNRKAIEQTGISAILSTIAGIVAAIVGASK
jgi:hypothetical protein